MKPFFLLPYFCGAASATALVLLVYAAVQQTYRQAADDPQIQIASELAHRWALGKTMEAFFSDTIELSSSSASFVELYSTDGRPLRSSGLLHGFIPQLPAGVLDFVKTHGQDRVSWQPEAGVRMAMVVLKTPTAPVRYVAVGRSLQETENREKRLRFMVFIFWSVLVGLITITACMGYWYRSEKNKFK
jgi:hypothetical protein